MTTQYVRYPSTGGAAGVPKYANAAALPAGASDGDTAVALNTDILYVYNAATTTWIPIAGPVVAAKYRISAATLSVSANTQINFDSSVYDTLSAVTPGASWKFTAPYAGFYSVQMGSVVNSGLGSYQLFKNGSAETLFGSSTATGISNSGSTSISLAAADVIDIRPGGASPVYVGGSTPYFTWVAINLIR